MLVLTKFELESFAYDPKSWLKKDCCSAVQDEFMVSFGPSSTGFIFVTRFINLVSEKKSNGFAA